jgi:N-methylhydantoinase B/oxoprolinase/acetone carboxylase alpha subunit
LPTTTAKESETMTTDNNDINARVAALEAANADMAEQLTHLFRVHGPATWKHIQKQRRDNAKAAGTKPPFRANVPHEVYRPKDHEK